MTTTNPPTTQMQRPTDKRMTLRNLFEHQRPELSKLLPKTMSMDRLFRMALTECVKNPALLECSAESWALAMQTCASQGLYPDSGLGLMYLIPRDNRKKGCKEVTAMRGYQGDIQLARNSGELLDIYAEVVYAKDFYKVKKGLARTIEHEPYEGPDEDPGPLVACYAVAKLSGGEVAWVTLRKRDVDRHKRSAQGTERPDSPWNQHTDQMWKKTAIRELFRWLPKATEKMQELAESDTPRQPAIDVSAIDVPLESGNKSGLDRLADRLEGQAPAQAETSQNETSGEVAEGEALDLVDPADAPDAEKEPETEGNPFARAAEKAREPKRGQRSIE